MKKFLIIVLTFISITAIAKPPTYEQFYDYAKSIGIIKPCVAMQLAVAETGMGKKAKYNNLFGFKGRYGYLKFKTWQASLDYYKKWQNRKYFKHLAKYHKNSKCNYYHFISSIGWVDGRPGSVKSQQYAKKLKKISLKISLGRDCSIFLPCQINNHDEQNSNTPFSNRTKKRSTRTELSTREIYCSLSQNETSWYYSRKS